jgi:hypothetical protein
MFENPDKLGWKIPTLYGGSLSIVPIPNDADGEEDDGALEIGATDTIGGSAVAMNKAQVEQLVAVLKQALEEW